MANSYVASRAHLVFALCLPLAVLLGYMLAFSRNDSSSLLFVMLMLGVLSIPVLMNWYHPLLILTWNAALTPYMLPGQPFIWMLVAFIGVGFAIFSRLTTPEARFISVPSVSASLLALSAVVLITAYLRGGMGIRVLGSTQYGGKGYYYILGAVAGYFALISKRLPKERAGLFVGLFFLAGLTSLIPNLAYLGGPKFNILFYFFPPAYAYEQALGDYAIDRDFSRVYGLTFASNGLYCFLLARYGLKGSLDITKPVRLALFVAAAAGSLFCGFRSFMLLFLLTVMVQFFTERLYRPRVLLALGGIFLIGCVAVLPNVDHLPLVAQRSISFLPKGIVSINPAIRQSAQSSSEWRIRMWRDVLPEVPSYLLLGKGYGLDPGELALAQEGDRRGWTTYQWALVTGAYHNGGLTLLVPFGVFGTLAFLWFAISSVKYLYHAYRYGDPALKAINTFLLACFIAKLIYYFGVFGSFFSDFFVWTGIIGLSVSLNGAAKERVKEAPAPVALPSLAKQAR